MATAGQAYRVELAGLQALVWEQARRSDRQSITPMSTMSRVLVDTWNSEWGYKVCRNGVQ